MPKKYTLIEVEELLCEFNLGTPLCEMALKLGRPERGIVQKIRRLSREDPSKWASKIVNEYQNQWYQQHQEYVRKYYQQHRKKMRGYVRRYREKNKGRWRRFGIYLAGLLEELEGSKKQVAEELQIYQVLLSQYLSGDRKPGKGFLVRVSERFNVPYQTLEDLLK